MSWTAIGAAIGVTLALALTRFLDVFLYGISPTDPLTFGAVTLLLGTVACTAALVPGARQPSGSDPRVAEPVDTAMRVRLAREVHVT